MRRAVEEEPSRWRGFQGKGSGLGQRGGAEDGWGSVQPGARTRPGVHLRHCKAVCSGHTLFKGKNSLASLGGCEGKRVCKGKVFRRAPGARCGGYRTYAC